MKLVQNTFAKTEIKPQGTRPGPFRANDALISGEINANRKIF